MASDVRVLIFPSRGLGHSGRSAEAYHGQGAPGPRGRRLGSSSCDLSLDFQEIVVAEIDLDWRTPLSCYAPGKEIVMEAAARRTSFVFLCCVPFLNFITAGDRALRIPGVYQVAGATFFVAVVVAAWVLAARVNIP